MKTIVSIKKLYYAAPLTKLLTPDSGLTGADVYAVINDKETKEILNVHDTTWVYEEAEASTTDYINQLTKKVYFRDSTPGAVQVSFSVGQYEYKTKADLQGGTATDASWKRPEIQELVYKTLVALTADDTYIIFPNASITARGGMVEDKVLGLLLAAVPMEAGVQKMESEGWFDASEVKGGTAPASTPTK